MITKIGLDLGYANITVSDAVYNVVHCTANIITRSKQKHSEKRDD